MKTFEEIVTDLIESIKNQNPEINTSVGTVVHDLLVNVPAIEFSNLYNEVFGLLNKFILNPTSLTEDDIIQLGQNIGIPRKIGSPSQGNVVFLAKDVTSNIIINAGTRLGTPPTSNYPGLVFILNNDVVIGPNNLNATTGFYEGIGTVTCTTIGSNTNISPYSITQILSTIPPNVIGVENRTNFTNGADTETTSDYLDRLLLTLKGGSIIGTLAHLEYLIKSAPNIDVRDFIILTPDNPELRRNPFGGSVDVFISFPNEIEVTETITPNLSNQAIPSYKPIIRAVSLPSGVSFNKDVDSEYSRSIKSKDYFQTLDTNPISVTYTYDKNVEDLQKFLDEDVNKLIISDILVKRGYPVLIKFETIKVKLKSGYDFTAVKNSILNSLTLSISTYKFKQKIALSDIINIIENVDGVDYLDVTVLKMYKKSEKNNDTSYVEVGTNFIQNSFNEYFVFDLDSTEIIQML